MIELIGRQGLRMYNGEVKLLGGIKSMCVDSSVCIRINGLGWIVG